MTPKKHDRAALLRVAARHGAMNVRIFGSESRGTARPESDIDVLVELEPGRSLIDLIGLKYDLEALFGRDVDVVTEASLGPYIREAVLREAVPV